MEDLSREERNAWIDSLEVEMKRRLESFNASGKALMDHQMRARKYAEEGLTIIRSHKRILTPI